MKKAALFLTAFVLVGIQAAFFVPVAFAQSDPILLQQPNVPLRTATVSLGTAQYIYSLGSGLTGSTTAIAISGVFHNSLGVTQHQFFRADLYDGINTCTYDGDLGAGATSTGVVVLSHQFQGIGFGCVLQSSSTYTLTITVNGTGNAAFDGVLQAVPPFTFVSSSPSSLATAVNPPYVIIYAQFSSLIAGGNSSGVSTSSVQISCNGSFATSTGFFSDISNGVSYGLCTATTFLFVPTQQSLQSFSNLNSTAQTKIPFSYFYGLYAIYDNLSASSTDNLPDYSIDLPAFGSTTALGVITPTHFDILSTTTISKYYPDSFRIAFLFLGTCAIWIEAAFIIYRRVVPHKAL